jgi:replicative DNA helicase
MEELLGRRVPYSSEAEQSILGSMLIDPVCIPDVVNKVKASEFYIDTNREIFETIFSMFSLGQRVDPVTVLDQMKVRGCWKDTSQQYLFELMDITPTAANVLEYCAIVRERALLRQLGTAASEISDMVYGGTGEAQQALELAERKIYALRKENTAGGLVPLTQVLQDVMHQISEAAAQGSKVPGLTTGLTDIDEALMGLGPGDLVLIASRPGMGKTSIALNMAVSAAKASGKTVAIFSLEMSRQQLVMRLLAAESHLDNYQLSQGRLSPEDWSRLAEAAGALSRIDIRIDDNPSMTVAEMSAQCRRLDNLGLVLVDYLQLMQSAGTGRSWANESRTQAVSDISRMMKVTAKELSVPLVCLSQLSRANESRQNKRPMLSDLRESGSIEQDADAVIGLYREGYYDRECEDPNAAEAIILKNRRGRVGTVYLRWLPDFTTYVNDERHRDEDEY